MSILHVEAEIPIVPKRLTVEGRENVCHCQGIRSMPEIVPEALGLWHDAIFVSTDAKLKAGHKILSISLALERLFFHRP